MFRYSICDPLKSEPIEMGEINKEKILDTVEGFPWTDFLDRMKGVKESEVYFSPSIELENKNNRHGLSISIIKNEKGNEFYIFFKRPKMVTKLFGLIKNIDEDFISDRTGQTSNDVQDAVAALINDDFVVLEKRWG
ncbi:hypothetical protein [Hymenobacter lapidiphilus]|uniref:Uncharacterized protein n=1 Tax=Hymenobacter lapidiphilus TaxID=2608003 RepID=A0A7Y7PS36_9BACT|nr:hypothetical protein [Hymenobacter lapidiphilus]NVO33011.1 hypothetical protein [Hymenobacter lapidiphilus]